MSTSFCYGCLYIVRKEVQGTGLTWKNMWEESSPGDPMSMALILFMIALDGCIYALIGYFITKYTNSGNFDIFKHRYIYNIIHTYIRNNKSILERANY